MEIIKAVGKEIYEGSSPILLRGFGLGGWFLPEGYMWKLYSGCDRPRRMEVMIESLCGKAYADSFWEKYLDSYITEKDIEFIAEEGFNSVRLPLNARHLYETRDNQFIINPEMFLRIDRLIEWCKKNNIYVILDMHGAPGGQTGQNIDDSEADQPYLFMDKNYEEDLIKLWTEFAKRYCEEEAVAGYDLMNEPLPNFFGQYNDQVLPLYRRLINEIRKVDKNHMIILEGVHWSTDFRIFDAFTKEEAADNIMLQFHKYWNNPDTDSIQGFIKKADALNVPLYMGEGGENNCDWYTTAFPLYEQLNISWNFWSYKKMDNINSPITFEVPEGWEELIRFIKEKDELSRDRAIIIFDNFIRSIRSSKVNKPVLNSLKRELPVKIPCEAYNQYNIISQRRKGAELRLSEPVSLLFENGKTGPVDYRGSGGKEQPEEDNIVVQLFSGDSVGYLFQSKQEAIKANITAEGEGELLITVNFEERQITINEKRSYATELSCIPNQRQYITLSCSSGNVKLDFIYLEGN